MTVRLVDPSGSAAAGAVVELTDREAAEVILVAQAEAGDALYDLARLRAAATALLVAVDALPPGPAGRGIIAELGLAGQLGQLKATVFAVRGDGETELDHRTGYPTVDSIGELLAMARDGELYLEHVRAHARPSPDLPHVFERVDEHDDCDLCGGGVLDDVHVPAGEAA